MRFILIVLIIISLFTACATPRPWTKEEKVSAGYFCLAHFADYYTTNQMLDNGHSEMNPALGDYPSNSKTTVYFSLTAIGALIIGHFWPESRKPLFISYGALNTGLAIHNSQLD